jgi:hypothetical protein
VAKKRYNASEPDEVRKETERLKEGADSDIIKLGNLLNHYAFREYVWNKMAFCGIFDAGYREGANLLYFYEGKRTVGQVMMNEILTHYPKQFTLMQTEAMQRDKEREDLE